MGSNRHMTPHSSAHVQDWQQLARTMLPLLERIGRSTSLEVPGVSLAAVTALARKVQGFLVQPVSG